MEVRLKHDRIGAYSELRAVKMSARCDFAMDVSELIGPLHKGWHKAFTATNARTQEQAHQRRLMLLVMILATVSQACLCFLLGYLIA